MKILIFGFPGAGKTTFANHLSTLTGTPVFHVDRHFFESGWVERPQEDFLKDVHDLLKQDSWIIDGNGMRTLEMRFKEADLVIYCRFSRLLCLYRIFKRMFTKEKPDGPDGATNSISIKLVKYLWNFTSRYDAKIASLRAKYPNIEFVCLQSPKEMDSFQQRFTK